MKTTYVKEEEVNEDVMWQRDILHYLEKLS